MTGLLCVGRDPEMWTPESPSARLAVMICNRCDGCPDNDDKPTGIIRHGVAYSNTGRPMDTCVTCGFPKPGEVRGRDDRCPRCDVPPLTRFMSSIAGWHEQGLTDTQSGARIGASAEQIRDARRRYGAKGTA